MKLYVDGMAPNARRVRMFVAEKGLDVAIVEVDTANGANRDPAFLAKNPLGQVPVLALDGGLCISESMAICRYLDEKYPEPNLYGCDPEDRAMIHMWARRAENLLFGPAVDLGHHSHPFFVNSYEPSEQIARLARASIRRSYALLDARLAASRFIARDAMSAADIVAYCGIEVARLWGAAPEESLTDLSRWHRTVGERPSARFARY